MEVMCFDGEGWLSPAGEQRGARSEKKPKNRLRQDINQVPRETPRDMLCVQKSASVSGPRPPGPWLQNAIESQGRK